jgi:hypothetical protein
MSAAVRSLLIFFFGVLVGALVILLAVPSFSITVTSVPKVTTTPVAVLPAVVEKPVEKVAPAKVEVAEKSEPVKVAEEKAPTKSEELVAKVEEPVKVQMAETKAPEAKTEVVAKEEPAPVKEATKPAANQKLDFAALNSRPIFWPASVQVTTATSTPLLEKGQKVADIPLNVGSVLQISKVLGDGALEVRAQGLKFEIDSRLTDFDSAVRKRIAELADKGSTIPPPFVQPTSPNYVAPIAPPPGRITLPATATTPAPAGTPAATTTPAAPADTTTKPKPKDKLDDKMNSLFGRRVPAGTDTNGDK